MSAPTIQPNSAASIVADLTISDHHTLQVVTFAPGMTGIIQTGRVLSDPPLAEAGVAPESAAAVAGEPPAGYEVPAAETTDEQTWFRQTHGNGAQLLVQGWNWAHGQSTRPVVSGSGIAMVGREGTSNATFRMLWWNNGAWVEFWSAVIVPGHWVSQGVTGQNKYIRWELNGAGSHTQVSLAARY